ncbi:MAG TPA: DUF362 domain-containing protein, partial [Dehalococcoidia bacterium]|nr:DUF362 domain-containing protein [Dehalococcoidia bacterium]
MASCTFITHLLSRLRTIISHVRFEAEWRDSIESPNPCAWSGERRNMTRSSTTPVDVYFTREMSQLPELMRRCGVDAFDRARVPVKLHMGEPGNPYIIRPELAATVVGALLDAGAMPFLFDTTVAYPGERSYKKGYERVARKHGFTRE